MWLTFFDIDQDYDSNAFRSACNEIISGVSRIAEPGVDHSYTSGAM